MSKTKRIIQIALLGVVVGSVSYIIAKELAHESHNDATIEEPAAATTEAPDHVTAYYFRSNFRCASCKKIEAYSKESIERNFSKELMDGILSFETINVEEPSNRHFVNDYGLYTKSLVIVSFAGGEQIKYKNLKKVWDLLDSKQAFEDYIKEELSGSISEVKR